MKTQRCNNIQHPTFIMPLKVHTHSFSMRGLLHVVVLTTATSKSLLSGNPVFQHHKLTLNVTTASQCPGIAVDASVDVADSALLANNAPSRGGTSTTTSGRKFMACCVELLS